MFAFAELVELYKVRVIKTCYRFLLNQEDAEDISQEVFIQVFQSISSFRGESKLSTWIYRIAVTKSLDELKKRNRKKRITTLGRILKLDEVVHFLGGGSKPDDIFEKNEKMGFIMQALDKLPDNQRVAFTLSKIEGYSNPEIAEIIQTTIDSVESLVKRAKRTLQTDLEIRIKGF